MNSSIENWPLVWSYSADAVVDRDREFLRGVHRRQLRIEALSAPP